MTQNRDPLFLSILAMDSYNRGYDFGITGLTVEFAFSLTSIEQKDDTRRCFSLSCEQIAATNPRTKTAPLFRSRADAELTADIYGRIPVLVEEKGGSAGNRWSVSFMAMLHMANDSGLFRTAAELQSLGYIRNHTSWVAETVPAPSPPLMPKSGSRDMLYLDSSSRGDASKRFVPLYEAKMIHQFDHRWATFEENGQDSRDATLTEKQEPRFEPVPRYWVSEVEVRERLRARGWERGWLIGWRSTGRAGDLRTMIPAALPSSAFSGKLPVALLQDVLPESAACFLGNLASIVLDYVIRQKVGGADIPMFVVEQLPILPPIAYSEADVAFIVTRVLELSYTSHAMTPFARDLGYQGRPFAWDEDRRAQLRAELDAWYALAYGLTRDQLRYVLDPKDALGEDYPSETFRVLKTNEERKYGEYRTRRLVLAAYDKLVSDGLRPRVEGHR